MENFLPPPCFRTKFIDCRNNDARSFQKRMDTFLEMITFRIESLFAEILQTFIYYINSDSNIDLKIPKWIYFGHSSNDTPIETNIKRSIFKLLIKTYKNNPDICVGEIKERGDIDFILKQNLNFIQKKFLEAANNPLNTNSRKAMCQTFFVECLLFAGKFTSHCISTVKIEKDIIFEKVIRQLDMFFHQQKMYSWIQHFVQVKEPIRKHNFVQVKEPFGKHKFFESSEDEENLDEEMD